MSGPRVTVGDIAAAIVGEYYFTAHEGAAGVQALEAARVSGVNLETATMGAKLSPVVVKDHPRLRDVTICVLVLRNAFVVVGTSIPVAPENFDAELGRKYAREDAVRQCWPLMGYALRERLHAETPRTPIWPQVAAPALVVHPTPTPTPPDPTPPPHTVVDADALRASDDGMPEVTLDSSSHGAQSYFDRMTFEEHQRAGHLYDAANMRWRVPKDAGYKYDGGA